MRSPSPVLEQNVRSQTLVEARAATMATAMFFCRRFRSCIHVAQLTTLVHLFRTLQVGSTAQLLLRSMVPGIRTTTQHCVSTLFCVAVAALVCCKRASIGSAPAHLARVLRVGIGQTTLRCTCQRLARCLRPTKTRVRTHRYKCPLQKLVVRAFDLNNFSCARAMDACQVVLAKMGDGFYRKQGSMRNNTMTF